MSSLNGKIFLYRVFDVGPDIDLQKLQSSLASQQISRFRLAKSSRAMIIRQAPLSLTLESGRSEIAGCVLDYELTAKIWHFGAISLNFQISFPPDLTWDRLVQLGSHLENDHTLHEIAVQRTKDLLQQINPAQLPEMNWETFEDYTIYFFKSLPGSETNAMTTFQNYDVQRLILSETTENLSEQIRKTILDGVLQYSQNDLAVINWNSALIIEPSGSWDIPDTIEFALCQLLEMRYYDDLLDDKLASLYSRLEKKSFNVLENYSEKLSKEAAQKYLEISDTIESVENSLKVVGDFYLAQIFRIASTRFRFNDWKESVDQKLSNLAEISKLLTSEINERRSHILEIVIIVLISIELIPFVTKLF